MKSFFMLIVLAAFIALTIPAMAAFDYDGHYTIVNGYGQGYTLGYPGLNNTGDIFPIALRNTVTGEVFPSFCANGGSTHFAGESGLGCTGYLVASKHDWAKPLPSGAQYENFVAAYRYIQANYCKPGETLDDYRAITQGITWVLLGAIDVYSPEFAAIEDWKLDKAAVIDVVKNYATSDFADDSPIVDVVFLVCEKHEHEFASCQPQLLPIYEDGTGSKDGEFNFIKYKYNVNTPAGLDEFTFKLYRAVEDGDAELVDTAKTEATGEVSFTFKQPGSYYIMEVDADGWDNNNAVVFRLAVAVVNGELKATVTNDVRPDNGVYTLLNLPVDGTGSLIVTAPSAWLTEYEQNYKEIYKRTVTRKQTLSEAYKSVTATTDAQIAGIVWAKNGSPEKKGNEKVIVPNANHFTFAKLAVADLVEGVDLTLVVGNKVETVGKGFAKIDENGKLALTFTGEFANLKFGAVAYTTIPEPKNGNIHSLAEFKHDNNAVINLPAADKNGFIYLYVHFDTLQFNLTDTTDPNYFNGWIYSVSDCVFVRRENVGDPIPDMPVEQSLDVVVVVKDAADGYAFPQFTLNKLNGQASYKIPDLVPGEYIITWSWVYGAQSGGGSETIVVAGDTSFSIPAIDLIVTTSPREGRCIESECECILINPFADYIVPDCEKHN